MFGCGQADLHRARQAHNASARLMREGRSLVHGGHTVLRLTRTPTDTTSRVLTSQHIRSELLPLSFVRLNILTASRWVSKTPSILAIVQQLQPKEISDEPRANEPYTNTTNTRQHQWCRRSLEHCDVCMTNWRWMHVWTWASEQEGTRRPHRHRTYYSLNGRRTLDNTRVRPGITCAL